MKKEYAFEGYALGSDSKYFADCYRTAGAAQRAAKEWIGGSNARRADILEREAPQEGHNIGAKWRIVDVLGYGGRKAD